MANTVTFSRIAASIVLLFCPVYSSAFYVFYIAAGVSDMLDGFVARKTDTVSNLGARLDTIADFVFVVACLIKLLPVLRIPAWLYGWTGMIALIKSVNIVSGFAVQKRFVAVHSVMNKVAGALLFLFPLFRWNILRLLSVRQQRLLRFRKVISSDQKENRRP